MGNTSCVALDSRHISDEVTSIILRLSLDMGRVSWKDLELIGLR